MIRRLRSSQDQLVIILLGAILVGCCLLVSGFRSPDNLATVARQASVLALLAIGQTFVVVAGMMDLSVGSLATLSVVLGAHMMNGNETMAVPGIIAVLVLGAGIGSVTGLLSNVLTIHPLILTTGMMTILQGVVFLYTDQSGGAPAPFLDTLANGTVWHVPVSVLLVLAAMIGGQIILGSTRIGIHLRAVGGSEDSARNAGVQVRRTKLVAFVISGLFAAAAGLLLLGRLGTGYPNAGTGAELDAILAVVLGGTSLAGGEGSVVASVAAALILGIASNVQNLLDVSSFFQTAVKGLIVVSVVLVNRPPRRVFA